MQTNLRVVTIALAMAGLGCGADQPTIPTPPVPTGTLIHAEDGGVVQLGNDVSLTIPAGSLSQDTMIDVVADVPVDGEGDGFTPLGTAYRFSPPGTQFDLAKPAILRMAFDSTQLDQQSLDGRTLELAYYDESIGRYFSIGGEVDPLTNSIVAHVEHFTLYLPMAAALQIGNNPPTVALQATVPTTIRANAPVYVRATIRDYDIGGAVAGAQLEYRQAGTSTFTIVPMHPETTLDTFAALIPTGAFTQGAGNDLEYRVTAHDNLGATTTSAIVSVDVPRSYMAGSLNLTPGTQPMAAGFDKLFAVKATDDQNVAFALVPDSAAATHGLISTSTAGVNYSARTVGVGQVQVHVGGDTATATVNISNGALSSIAILDQYGQPFDGTQVVREGTQMSLDALGYDAWGNQVLVTPTWTNDARIGVVDSSGMFSALDGTGTGAVQATIGNVTGTQWFKVNEREWETSATFVQADQSHHFDFDRLTTRNGVPYIAYLDFDGVGTRVQVAHFNGATWTSDGSPNPSSTYITCTAIGGGTSRLEVAWMENARLYAAHLEGTTWVRDGDTLTVDTANVQDAGRDIAQITMAFDGDVPWIAFHELAVSHYSSYVRYWTGTTWSLVGGALEANGPGGVEASIAIHGGIPYVAYNQFGAGFQQIFVKKWDGAQWSQIGGTLNEYPSTAGQVPNLVFVGDRPTVAFGNVLPGGAAYYLFVKQWDGATWSSLGGIRNDSNFAIVDGWSLTTDGDVPYLAFIEHNPNGLYSPYRQTEHYNARTGAWTSLSAWNVSPLGPISITMVGHTPYFSNASTDFSIAVLGLTL